MGESLQDQSGNLAHVATVTSRPEALVIASALEHAGIPVWIDGVNHAGADPISIALGGFRLRVFAEQWQECSAVLREIGLPTADLVWRGQQREVLKFISIYLGSQLFLLIPAIVAGMIPMVSLFGTLLSPLGIPVDPRGRNDYYLTTEN